MTNLLRRRARPKIMSRKVHAVRRNPERESKRNYEIPSNDEEIPSW